jgi:uncharacterized protein (DUF1800 family)
MSASEWARYRPTQNAAWNFGRAWTLRRRAGHGATWAELERDVAAGPDTAIDRVLAGTCRSDGVVPDFSATADLLGDAAASSSDDHRLQAWWLYRMLFTPDPLTERLTLLWHDHFATSQLKVENVSAMRQQNETLRRHARGPFGELVKAMLRDPALLFWLDAPSNQKGKPNENLARELMELFTLGVGNYSESDVKAAARALTGWTVVQGRFEFRAADHDTQETTILGKTESFDGEQLASLLLDHPAIAQRVAWRLCHGFLGEGVASDSATRELADQLRRDNLHIGRAVETILRSERFFSPANLHSRVLDPVGFVIGAVRSTEQFDPPPSTLLLGEWTRRIGQVLFFPPNVGGWPGGRSWLSGRAVLARGNFAAALVEGRLRARTDLPAPNLEALATKHGRGGSPAEAVGFYGELFTGRRLDSATCEEVLKMVATRGLEAGRVNQAAAMLLARPDAQVC